MEEVIFGSVRIPSTMCHASVDISLHCPGRSYAHINKYHVFTYPFDRLKKTKNRFVKDKKVRVVIHTLGR